MCDIIYLMKNINNNIIYHHETIWSRFVISKSFYEKNEQIVAILENIKTISGRSVKIESVEIDFNDNPILCITFNIEPIPVSEKIKETIKYSIYEKFGLDSSIWDSREKNQTIVLVFEKIPEYLYLELKKIDNEWIKNKEYLNG